MARPLAPEELQDWSQVLHLLVLDALMKESSWNHSFLVFHGGTSLHLSWRSPRFSEDLDFLLNRSAERSLDSVMKRTHRRVQDTLLARDPHLQVEMTSREGARPQLKDYRFKLSREGVLGKARVKVEFWMVSEAYLTTYATTSRAPSGDTALVGVLTAEPVPSATLESAYCDKLVAFATRPRVKWRDLFDLWWIRTNSRFDLPAPESLARTFLDRLAAYQTVEGLSPSAALRRFAGQMTEDMVIQSERDLKPWLPEALWAKWYPDEVRVMVSEAREGALSIAGDLDRIVLDADPAGRPPGELDDAAPSP